MSQRPRNRSARYYIFVFSLWETGSSVSGGPTVWRYSLEHGPTGERRGFKSLDELMAYLEAFTQRPPGGTAYARSQEEDTEVS